MLLFTAKMYGLPLLPFLLAPLLLIATGASAHDVSPSDREILAGKPGLQLALYAWLGAKHMVTGYDHLLFLVGVIFYLRRLREIALFVSLFALGHTLTLVSGVLLGLEVNAFVVDAIIGLSVAYKGFDNLGGFQRLFGDVPDERLAVFIFGLFHGLGLASKLQDLGLNPEGLLGNLIAFNIGVEIGQLTALVGIVFALRLITNQSDTSASSKATTHKANSVASKAVNGSLMIAGFALMTYQLARYWVS